MTKKGNILIVNNILQLDLDELDRLLKKEGYHVDQVEMDHVTYESLKQQPPDLLIIAHMIPIVNNYSLCRNVKSNSETLNTFVIVVVDKSDEISEIEAFENGADDFLVQPLKNRAFVKRVNKIFTRKLNRSTNSKLIENGKLIINRESYSVFLSGRELNMPKKEFDLLRFLASNPQKVFSRDDLLINIWESDYDVQPRTVDVHIRKIRDKIGDDYISTIKGVGYRFNVEGA